MAYTGGTVTFKDLRTEDGRRAFQVGHTDSRPVPMVLIGNSAHCGRTCLSMQGFVEAAR